MVKHHCSWENSQTLDWAIFQFASCQRVFEIGSGFRITMIACFQTKHDWLGLEEQEDLPYTSMAMQQEPIHWRYFLSKAYFLGLYFRESPKKIWPNIWYQRTSISKDPEIPIDLLLNFPCIYIYIYRYTHI